MVTRCIHNRHDLCSRCSQKAERDARDGDDRYWMKDERNGDWVYNPNIFRNSEVMPRFQGPQSTAGPVVEGVRQEPTHWQAEYDDNLKVWQYRPVQAQQQTIQQMPTDLTNTQVAELRAKLDTAVNSASEWQRIANESLAERKAMSARHHAQLDQIEKNQPTTASKMEVSSMTEKRIGDSDRNRFIEHLGNMFADGHLSEDEFGERSDKANAAKTMADLRPLVADLPDMPPAFNPKPVLMPKQHVTFKQYLAKPASPPFVLSAMGFLAVMILLLIVLL